MKLSYLENSNHVRLALYFTISLVCIFAAQSWTIFFMPIQEGIYLLQPFDMKGISKGIIYWGSYLFSSIAIILIMLSKQRTITMLLLTYIALAYGIDYFIQMTDADAGGISFETFSLSIQEHNRADNLLIFKTQLVNSCLLSFLTLFAALLFRYILAKNVRIHTLLNIFFFITAIILTTFISSKIATVTNKSFPPPIKLPIIAATYFWEHQDEPDRLLPSNYNPKNKEYQQTIIWIIDESISGNYLSINGYKQDTTPFLSDYQTQLSMQNYGVVTSISNCSNTSNLLLRIGLTSSINQSFRTPSPEWKNFDYAKSRLPTIYQYAQRAGFETYLIDAQASKGEMTNHLTNKNRKFINHYITFDRQVYPSQRDQHALSYLHDLLQEDNSTNNPKFIVLIKWGAHWPYSLAYPEDHEIFSPAGIGGFTEISEENRQIIMNSYANALRYTVDGFLREMLTGKHSLPLHNSIIFYTSDHGQSLLQGIRGTHCHYSEGLEKLSYLDEFKVPLIIFSENAKHSFPLSPNKYYFQEQLFPTTLKLFGYPSNIYQKFGATLLEGSDKESTTSFIALKGRTMEISHSIK